MYSKNNKIILLVGGARSGKSNKAQEMALKLGNSVLFCATAEPLDDEMLARIETHKKTRPSNWDTIESSRNIGRALEKTVSNYDSVIIDCIDLMAKRQSNYILVSNEVGSGLVPDNKLGRIYRDTLGQVNQQLAKCADEVYFMAAGLSLKMK